jgi:hypothetical protein
VRSSGGRFNVDDPAQALRDLLSITDVDARNQALRELLDSVPREQLPELFERFSLFMDSQEFEDELGGLITAMSTFEVLASHVAATAPRECLEELINRKNDKVDNLCPLLLRQWAARDFSAALAFFDGSVRSQDNESLRKNCAEALAREYAKINPEQAMTWVARLPEDARENATHAAFQTLSHRDPVAAGRLVVERTDLPGRENIAADLAAGWAKTEPEKALRWSVGLPPELAKRAAERTIEEWSSHDFKAAAAQVSSLEPAIQAAVLPTLANRVDAGDAAVMTALIDQQPEGEGRANAAKTLMARWAPQAPEDASRWLASQPPGKSRDEAVVSFSGAMGERDPEAALEWTTTIGNDSVRSEQLTRQVDQWAKKDPAAAQAWIASSARLASDDRDRLLRRIAR